MVVFLIVSFCFLSLLVQCTATTNDKKTIERCGEYFEHFSGYMLSVVDLVVFDFVIFHFWSLWVMVLKM